MSDAISIGATALTICRALRDEDVLYLADDDQHAEALAAAVRALAPEVATVFLPSSDTLPGDRAPASPANIGRRVSALRRLRRLSQCADRPRVATIMSGEAAARLHAEPAAFDAAPPVLRPGDRIASERFAEDLAALGYVLDDRVDEPGEAAIRGDVIDIFPADAGNPARIEFADGRITAIRRYDPVSQLSEAPCEHLEIGRAAEPDDSGRTHILAHLQPGLLLRSGKAEARRQRFIRLAREAAGEAGGQHGAVEEAEWTKALARWRGVDDAADGLVPVPRFSQLRAPLAAMARFVAPLLAEGRRLLLVGSERDIRFLRRRVERRTRIALEPVVDLTAGLALPGWAGGTLVAPIERGTVSDALVMIAAGDILGSRALVGDAPEPAATVLARTGGDIRQGDIVIHETHGVGRVAGLEPDPEGGELIALDYARGGRRLVPVREAGRIWRYGADGDAVSLDRLDGASWNKRRGDIDAAIAGSVRALLALASERAGLEAPIMEPDPALYERFVASFPFNETADQARAIQAVRDDLASGRPMDRLVIGDVGYGKTEIALRAAALAALAGYQVVVAAPTTVLVRQHLHVFERRFAGTGLRVAGLSRLSDAAERKAVKAGLRDGTISVVIGTGAVMAKDVRYARCGLVIIDEEQRFGAADKARLRGRPDIHLLAMSATPIPRTLHRALTGLQQMSVIATPPARRQPIRTSLVALDDTMLRTALLREHSRGGQSFVVVPRIGDLAPVATRLRRLIPELALVEAHGKMPAAELDAAMVGFADGRGDVLLATNIIEAGLDVPRANTMIVWRADRFGLAQLHQLRGRVGRGNRRGQVMLVTDGEDIAERTMKRLRTLATLDQLGAGFGISAADLDQRGAGDPLSDTQVGHMKLIGVDLYQHLFESALRQARGEDGEAWVPEINLAGAGALPADWIPEADIRLGLYVRLARITDDSDLDAFEDELADRFGPIPPPAEALLRDARIAMLARAAGIARIDAGPAAIALTPQGRGGGVPKVAGLVEKQGRWLLRERTGEEERPARVIALLEALVAET